nr:MAG TPA: hypothetical protein [Caudoviricetes sp.]
MSWFAPSLIFHQPFSSNLFIKSLRFILSHLMIILYALNTHKSRLFNK